MKILLGGIYQPMLDGSSVQIQRAMSDPVPTCSLTLIDNNASIQPQPMQELIVLDDQVIPNPTQNLIVDPDLNPYNASIWSVTVATGITSSQVLGGGAAFTFANAAAGTGFLQEQAFIPVIGGQIYTFSGYMQASGPPTNFGVNLKIGWSDINQNLLSTVVLTGAVPIATAFQRYALTATAPANAVEATVLFEYHTTSSTNSGTVAITQAQFEQNSFPTLSYPTPFCGPNQTNCVQLPYSGLWIRQYRKFAGFVNHAIAQNYHGNVRQWQVDAVGYAWLFGTIIVNNSYTSHTDAFIIGDLISKYLSTSGASTVNILTTTNVITGVTVSNLVSNWDDLRTIFDGLAGLSGFYYTVDPYWNMIYAPPGYITMPISLICDNSSQPDNVTTFPAYGFSAETDYTQPGSVILVIGNGSNVAEVIDPNMPTTNATVAGYHPIGTYQLPITNIWMRKINDSTLGSTTDCTNRGMAELLQYDKPRNIYHLTTNVELVPGQGVAVTSNTDGLNKTVLLVQQTTAKWLGTNETLTDEWEYTSDLGATNRAATNIMSRLFRLNNQNTSAPAISSTTLAAIENVAVNDTIDGGSLYAQTVLSDSPFGYYRHGEPAGFSITSAYDWSGNTFTGTYGGGFTLGQPGAIYNDSNTAVLFNGSTGKVDLAAGLSVTGLSAVTLEAWVNLSTTTFTNARVLSNDHTSADNKGCELIMSSNATGVTFTVGNGSTFLNLAGSFTFSASTWYHVVATWSASGGAKIYVNGTSIASGSLSGTIAAPTNSMGIAYAPATNANFFPGTLDEVAIYPTSLSLARIQAHYNVGTLGHP